MPDVAKLKKKAADFELKKQFDKALAVYVEILQGFDASADDVDVSLFNRVGDLYLKQGSVGDAVDYYEQAVDRYAEGGFHNNAIALCNKILRNSPGRASVYYKLGKISAQKGFKGDAKKNFLEYADRMQTAGKLDEAFRALKEFADLCPDQDDIRLLLAEQLSKQGRGPEAIEQLQTLYERYSHEGRATEARATVDRMKAIDPDAEPREGGDAPRRHADELVFLDLSPTVPARTSAAAKRATQGLAIIETLEEQAARMAPPARPAVAAMESPVPSIDFIDTNLIEPAVLDGVTRVAEFEAAVDAGNSVLLEGLESTSFSDAAAPDASEIIDLEPTSFQPDLDSSAAAEPELFEFDLSGDEESSSLTLEYQPSASIMGLPMLTDDVPSDLPLMDFELPMQGEASTAIAGVAHGEVLAFNLTTPASSEIIDFPSIDDAMFIATPPDAPRQSTAIAAHSVDLLQALSDADPDDHGLRRKLAEARLESGDREGGIRDLEAAMSGYERSEDLQAASKVADEIVLLNPSSVKHHQKRVEYAFRTDERGRLIEAYLQLADALFRAGQVEKSRAIYQRVIDLSPEHPGARAALDTFPPLQIAPEPARPRPAISQQHQRVSLPTPAASMPPVPAPTPDGEYINLGDWLRDGDAPKDTRMVVNEQEPTGDEEADFQDMLQKFKQGISENVEEEDHQSHYDLGVAYKEMGLLDEAIAEFQKALRAPVNRVPTYEALGQCFMEKAQYPMAMTLLARATNEPGMTDDKLIGVLYLLGNAAAERGQRDLAIEYYQRVFLVDIQFRDVGERLAAIEAVRS